MTSINSTAIVPKPKSVSLHGDFWTRFLLWLMRWLPESWMLFLVRPISVVFFLAAKQQRAGIICNLRALHPEMGPLGLWCASHAVFVQFALTYMDRLWHMHFQRDIEWEFENDDALKSVLRKPGGILLFTLHSGNYDIAATLIYDVFKRPLHIVRKRERSESLQKIRSRELELSRGLHVHYNDDPWALGVELCELLQAGEVVAVLADRPVAGLSTSTFDHEGLKVLLPQGPLVLAQVARVPCFPIFLTRLGVCRYRATFGSAIYDGARRESADQIGHAWLSVMMDFLRCHFDQWFVFENVIAR